MSTCGRSAILSFRAARATGIPLEPVPVPTPDDLSCIRRWWRVRQLLFHLRPPYGFSYSPECLAAVWDNNERFPDGVEILNYFQLLSPRILDRVEAGRLSLSFYVDITFRELLRQYPRRWTVNPAIATWTEALERRGYHAARRVIVFSSSSARVITEAMAVPASKVHVVTPGANVDEALINDACRPQQNPQVIPLSSDCRHGLAAEGVAALSRGDYRTASQWRTNRIAGGWPEAERVTKHGRG